MMRGFLQMKFITKTKTLIPAAFVIMFIGSSCTNQNTSEFAFDATAQHDETIDSLIDNLPPYEHVILPVKQSGSEYNPGLFYDNTIDLPSDNTKAALQTGTLMSDLAYFRYYEQVHKSMHYASMLEKHINAFDLPQNDIRELIISLEQNINEQDSIIHLLGNAYNELNRKLTKAERTGFAVLIMTGSWIESNRLMLGSEYQKEKPVSDTWEQNRMFLENHLLPLLNEIENSTNEKIVPRLETLTNQADKKASLNVLNQLHTQITSPQKA